MRAAVLFAGLLIALGGAARAEVDFAAIPLGCSWTTRYGDGTVQTETYLGPQDGQHLTRVTDADGAEVRRMTYNAKGWMVRKDWADGHWESFTPYSCFSGPGRCTYRYRNAHGEDLQIISETRASGQGFVVRAARVGSDPYPDDYFELGPFGLMVVNRGNGYSVEVTDLLNCAAGS
jgi:YD repeat-containing protein